MERWKSLPPPSKNAVRPMRCGVFRGQCLRLAPLFLRFLMWRRCEWCRGNPPQSTSIWRFWSLRIIFRLPWLSWTKWPRSMQCMALFQVDVLQVNRFLKFIRITKRNQIVIGIEQVALSIVLEHRPENPSVTVESQQNCVSVSSLLNSGVPVFSRKFTSAQFPRMAVLSGSTRLHLLLLLWLGCRCSFGYILSPSISLSHQVVAEVSRDHVGAGMDMADDALARRN